MTRMTGPDCAVMCNLITIYTHRYLSPPIPEGHLSKCLGLFQLFRAHAAEYECGQVIDLLV